jgi:O-acetylserine/cysteine efflux transporter
LVFTIIVPILTFIGLSLLFDNEATRWRWIAAPWSSWLSVAFLGWGGIALVVAALLTVMFG